MISGYLIANLIYKKTLEDRVLACGGLNSSNVVTRECYSINQDTLDWTLQLCQMNVKYLEVLSK